MASTHQGIAALRVRGGGQEAQGGIALSNCLCKLKGGLKLKCAAAAAFGGGCSVLGLKRR